MTRRRQLHLPEGSQDRHLPILEEDPGLHLAGGGRGLHYQLEEGLGLGPGLHLPGGGPGLHYLLEEGRGPYLPGEGLSLLHLPEGSLSPHHLGEGLGQGVTLEGEV